MSRAGKRHVPRDQPRCTRSTRSARPWLYTAAVSAAAGLGFAITHTDDAMTTFSFRARGPVGSWPIDQMTAVIRPCADGARIVIGAERLTGYRLHAFDWHQANAIGLMLLDRMKSVLPAIAEPASTFPSPPRSPAEELATLGELRDRGFLTEEEFTAEMDRLLR
jgi:hypothetical protein